MEEARKGRTFRYGLLLLELLAFLLGISLIGRSALASWEAEKNDIRSLEIAIRLDPTNSDFHVQLGRLYEYIPSNLRPSDAMQEFRRAGELNAFDAWVWVNLAEASEFDGNVTTAETDLRRADYLAPRLTDYQWPIGNFFLLQGNTSESFAHFKMVLAGTRKYDEAVFETAWKASDDGKAILDDLIPDNIEAEFSYLNFLSNTGRFPEAHAVWERISASRQSFDPTWTAISMDCLIRARHADEAFAVWADLGKSGLLPIGTAMREPNLVSDGDFEWPLEQYGFGWRTIPARGVVTGLDTLSYHSPNHSLQVQFSAQENLEYRGAFEFVKVEPNHAYHLSAFLKTEKITTDSGPRLEARDAYDLGLLDQFTESLTGTTGGWVAANLDFKTGPKTDLIVISLSRFSSQKLDNQISGTVWLDDVKLIPE